jgi:hypothetical protein
MAKNVKINGVEYANVASVKLPLTADVGTFALFYDTDSGDALATDILSGKKAWVGGVEVTGSIAAKTSDDITVNGKTVTVPAGHYVAGGSKDVADGSATPTVTVAGSEIGDIASSYPITINPKTTVNTAGYISTIADGAQVTKYIQTETKNATPSGSSQDITPTAGKLLSKVTVAAVALSGNAVAGDVLNGKTFYNTSLTKQTGTLTVPSLSLTSGVLTIS